MTQKKGNYKEIPNKNPQGAPHGVSSHSLRDLEKRYQEIFESAIDGLLVADTETKKFLFANSSILEMLGYSEAEILKLSVFDIHPEEDLDYVISQFKAQVDRKIKTARALPILRKDGTVFHADVTSLPIKIDNRNGLLGIFRDVSERQSLETDKLLVSEALEASESKYRSLAESSQDAIFVINRDDDVVYVNEFAAGCLDCTPQDIIGKSRTSLFPPEMAKHQTKSLDQVFKTGETLVAEGPIKYPHKEIWGITMLAPIKDKNGAVKSIMGVTRDISIRKREEKYREMLTKILEALNRSSLGDALKDILTAIKTSARIDAIAIRMENDGDYPYLITDGFPEDFIKIENSVCVISPLEKNILDEEGNKKLECICGAVLKGEIDTSEPFFTQKGSFWTNCTTELMNSADYAKLPKMLRNRCNAYGFESVALIPLSNEDKKIFGLLQLNGKGKGCFSKELINFLERAASSIAVAINRQKIEEDRKMIELQLHQSQKMEAIGRLVNSTAHDFNNIIAVVKGNSELLLSSINKNPENPLMEAEALEEIITAADSCSSLTNQLLEFSKPHGQENNATTDLVKLVKNTENMIQRLMGERIQLSLSIPEESLMVKISPSRIEQILINLAVNSRDAMVSIGECNITVSQIHINSNQKLLCGELKPDNYILLSFKDTGCGMAPEIISMVYEPFFTTKTGHGNGLGLSTVYGIVNQARGGIEINSKINNGTEFRIYFPEATSHAS